MDTRRRFLRRLPQPQSRAMDGEWLALELGVKPILRDQWDPTGPERPPAPPGFHEAIVEGEWLLAQHVDSQAALATDQRIDAADQPRHRVCVRHIGRDRAHVEQAAELERAILFAHYNPGEVDDLLRRHGLLLGYPPCCVDAFVGQTGDRRNAAFISAAAARSDHFLPLLNNISLGFFYYVGWFPCRYDCEASLAIARVVDRAMQERRPRDRALIRRALDLPRLYLDDRRQLLLDGRCEEAGVYRYRDLFPAFALDGRRAQLDQEWAFWQELALPLLAGDRLETDQQELRIHKGERLVARLARPAGLTELPFGR